jgi:hypothetical protein
MPLFCFLVYFIFQDNYVALGPKFAEIIFCCNVGISTYIQTNLKQKIIIGNSYFKFLKMMQKHLSQKPLRPTTDRRKNGLKIQIHAS